MRYEDVLEDIIQRDYKDSHRAIAPLKPTRESIIFGTTPYDLEESTAKLLSILKEKTV